MSVSSACLLVISEGGREGGGEGEGRGGGEREGRWEKEREYSFVSCIMKKTSLKMNILV